ncbi:hypothetical protein A3A66_04250 [Microgenomates group bacterium RIFCSPLOWO2_01_FULL_46_13]|nr:MAG: hypothetical protein A3A66_04250 [Microgenomates group bacterium RIFCSPLOWO2_01_FULL_46_13]
MSFRCDNCGRGTDYGNLVSHAKNRVKTRRKPNLHRVRVVVAGKIIKRLLCSRCIRRAIRPHKVKLTADKSSPSAMALQKQENYVS